MAFAAVTGSPMRSVTEKVMRTAQATSADLERENLRALGSAAARRGRSPNRSLERKKPALRINVSHSVFLCVLLRASRELFYFSGVNRF